MPSETKCEGTAKRRSRDGEGGRTGEETGEEGQRSQYRDCGRTAKAGAVIHRTGVSKRKLAHAFLYVNIGHISLKPMYSRIGPPNLSLERMMA